MINRIRELSESIGRTVNIMEVCGTHTVSIHKNGIKSLIPKEVNFISGPGCPVCVTEPVFIDKAVTYLRKGYHVFTFGDMLKVPGSVSSLIKEDHRYVHVVYSPLDIVRFARDNPDCKCLFLAIGFETTIPLIAAMIKDLMDKDLKNVFVLSACKLVPPVLKVLLEDKDLILEGFLLPGHVSAIIGRGPYREIFSRFSIPGVIAGFKTEDILESLTMLLEMIIENNNDVAIQYKRVVSEKGNPHAKKMIEEVFSVSDAQWRGLGRIKDSGLKLNKRYQKFDIQVIDPVEDKLLDSKENEFCLCAQVLKGKAEPTECRLFGKVCNPQNPVGPCMVSSEGACSAYYKYGR